MTQHTKIIYIIGLLYFSLGCTTKQKKQQAINTEQGKWYCVEYNIDDRISTKFGNNYAEEIKNHSSLTILKDTIIIKGCSYYYKTVSYNKVKRYSNEDLIVSFFKKPPPYKFINLTPLSEYCNNLDYDFIYLEDNDTLVLYSDGFYFSYKNSNSHKSKYNISGFPCDYRNPWSISGNLETNSLETAFSKFRKEFPFGSENLLNRLPKTDIYDEVNGVTYRRQDNQYYINKEVSAGNVLITLVEEKDNIFFTYELKYLEY